MLMVGASVPHTQAGSVGLYRPLSERSVSMVI